VNLFETQAAMTSAVSCAKLGGGSAPCVTTGLSLRSFRMRRCGRAAKLALIHATANATTSIGRHVSGIADSFNGHIDPLRIAHIQRSDGWIATTWNKMSNPGAFAAAGAEEQQVLLPRMAANVDVAQDPAVNLNPAKARAPSASTASSPPSCPSAALSSRRRSAIAEYRAFRV
jgi:hypothetical protein